MDVSNHSTCSPAGTVRHGLCIKSDQVAAISEYLFVDPGQLISPVKFSAQFYLTLAQPAQMFRRASIPGCLVTVELQHQQSFIP